MRHVYTAAGSVQRGGCRRGGGTRFALTTGTVCATAVGTVQASTLVGLCGVDGCEEVCQPNERTTVQNSATTHKNVYAETETLPLGRVCDDSEFPIDPRDVCCLHQGWIQLPRLLHDSSSFSRFSVHYTAGVGP